jgi:hypothetical protein
MRLEARCNASRLVIVPGLDAVSAADFGSKSRICDQSPQCVLKGIHIARGDYEAMHAVSNDVRDSTGGRYDYRQAGAHRLE